MWLCKGSHLSLRLLLYAEPLHCHTTLFRDKLISVTTASFVKTAWLPTKAGALAHFAALPFSFSSKTGITLTSLNICHGCKWIKLCWKYQKIFLQEFYRWRLNNVLGCTPYVQRNLLTWTALIPFPELLVLTSCDSRITRTLWEAAG